MKLTKDSLPFSFQMLNVFKLPKQVLIKLKVNIARDKAVAFFKSYRDDQKGKQLAYYLTHIDKHNFEDEQKELLYSILKYAKENIPYYRKVMADLILDKKLIFNNLKDIPLLSKAIIRENAEKMYSDNFERDLSYWKKTGGSTGEPLHYPVSRNFEYVHGRCLYTIMGAKKKDIIVAIDGSPVGEELRAKKIFWNEGTPNFPYGCVHYSTAYMNDENMSYYVNHLNTIKPSIMRGHSSGFQYLSKYLIANNIKLEFALKGIYLTAESFDSDCFDLIKKSLKCPIYGQYGHSEVSIFAFTMADSFEYLCSPLYGYTEILNENGSHVKENEAGEVVVTGFSNKVMPFIRYKTGDIAVYGGVKNGVVKLKSLQGRTLDYLLNDNNKKVFILSLLFSRNIDAFEKIQRWQIEQNVKGHILVRILPQLELTDKETAQMIHFFKTLGLEAELKFVDNIPLTGSGKRRFLIQNTP